jgi:hypothetical protein
MTEKAPEDIFKDMSLSTVLVAILDTLKEINVPSLTFLDAGKEDKELQVDYNSDTQSFTFKLRSKSEQRDIVTD